jgi:hypothetical protein
VSVDDADGADAKSRPSFWVTCSPDIGYPCAVSSTSAVLRVQTTGDVTAN